ncbi:MAG: Fic family protein [Planctomycetota bacterium]|nr:Fic family protein [Planctomycetota bacterium]
MFAPKYRITGKVAKALMSIEADRQVVATLPLTAPMLDSLRRTARLLSTHFSTQIEGNKLSPSQVKAVVEGEGNFPGRERYEAEVRHYFAALEHVERLGHKPAKLTESEVRAIHGLVMTGKAKPTPYRDGQNVIRDSRTGQTVYMPPEAKDVPTLMKELVRWVNESIAEGELPVPVITALAHYQFATVHPYFDGNGRTARLLSNLLLHRNGYGLNGIYSLEEYYASKLDGYYAGLAVGNSHNYYFVRVEGEVTPFIAYFCLGMADAFAKVRMRAEEASQRNDLDQTPVLRELTPQQRQALGLFLRMKEVTRNDMAAFFKLPTRQAYLLCTRWLRDEFIVVENPSTKGRSYRLAEQYEGLVAQKAGRTMPKTKPKRRM